MTRQRLPNRRPHVTTARIWSSQNSSHLVEVTVGFDPDTGEPRECFANVPAGGMMQTTLSDACVIISLALQHDIKPSDLAKSLASVPAFLDGEEVVAPASPVGTIMEAIIEASGQSAEDSMEEAEHGSARV